MFSPSISIFSHRVFFTLLYLLLFYKTNRERSVMFYLLIQVRAAKAVIIHVIFVNINLEFEQLM